MPLPAELVKCSASIDMVAAQLKHVKQPKSPQTRGTTPMCAVSLLQR
jgi:hypothetical protein